MEHDATAISSVASTSAASISFALHLSLSLRSTPLPPSPPPPLSPSLSISPSPSSSGACHRSHCLHSLRLRRREFKERMKVDKVVVSWTSNTERYNDVVVSLNDTMENLLASLDRDEKEISPSTLYAIACVLENVPFINGSPQNTFVPVLIDLAIHKNSLIGGDDFKSGQTKMKSVLVDFLVGAGIKPTSILSYNHLGNNDGMNLSAPQTFRLKEISKSNAVNDVVSSNGILYEPDEHLDHVIMIKYVPYVGDSKRAMDECTSEIFMGG